MEFEQYVAARYGRLIEHAVLSGCAEGEAGTYVDRVLLENKKAIRRAEDPDPLVHAALERAISGQRPERPGRGGSFLAIGLVLLVVGVGAALTYRPQPAPVPSLFGLDGPAAQRLLEDQGYDVVLRPTRACEPEGLVLGSQPATGTLARPGTTVSVRTAIPSGPTCDAEYAARSDAWAFVAFALGEGEAPEFTRTVTVVVDNQDPYRLDRVAAVDRDRWGGLLDRVARAARAPAPTDNGMPRLVVRRDVLPVERCGVRPPPGAGGRPVLRFEVDVRRPDDASGCPLTVDLYRTSDRVIEAVVLHTAQDEDRLSVEPTGLRPAGPTY